MAFEYDATCCRALVPEGNTMGHPQSDWAEPGERGSPFACHPT
jgi:hypothetical protein